MFIRVIDQQCMEPVFLNIHNIACIYSDGGIIMNGNHNKGNGIIRVDNDDMKRVMDNIEVKEC